MTKAQQDGNITKAIAHLRAVLVEIEQSQKDGDDLLTMEIAETMQEHVASIMWSASANAHEVPGTSWAVIGGRLGISRQAAHQRFSGSRP
jgi:biotin operon repressor